MVNKVKMLEKKRAEQNRIEQKKRKENKIENTKFMA